ncbi:type II toxin-antitoxin system HicB family antitoxin [Candidatus Palauibacter sp.]|uniref:type II toxin-antitoxin system HicB family antitoxin n=1 Tax=Candidatus Palauibacter sp. TaxID=3101350 RepID=UPI003B521410
MIEYKGYTGVFEYDEDYEFFSGRVIDTRDGINFEGRSVSELKVSMRRAVDDYLEFCEEKGREPSKPYSGRVVAAFAVYASSQRARAGAATGGEVYPSFRARP